MATVFFLFASPQYICDAYNCNESLYFHWDIKLHFMAVLLCGAVNRPIKCYGGSVSTCPESRLGLAITVKKENIKQLSVILCIGQNVQLSNNFVCINCVNVKWCEWVDVDVGLFPLPYFCFLISAFLPSSLGQYTFCYIKGIHRTTWRYRLTYIHTPFYNQRYLNSGGGVSERATPSCQQPNQSVLPFAIIRGTLTLFSPLFGEIVSH